MENIKISNIDKKDPIKDPNDLEIKSSNKRIEGLDKIILRIEKNLGLCGEILDRIHSRTFQEENK